ncbi:hypothetical protein GCM10028805_06240 [Spirosoma harenae]
METIVCLAFGIGAFWLILQQARNRHTRGQALQQAYRRAIASGDRNQALTCGRTFYDFGQNGKLTLNDELLIKKDLCGMA